MPSVAEVTEYLAARGIAVQTYAADTPTAATAAAAVGCAVGEIAKTLLFLVGGEPVVVVTAGDHKVKGAKLKAATGRAGKVRLPDAAEVEQHTGYRPGGVCPFLLPPHLPVVVDRSLRRFATVYPAAGDDHTAVPITVERLLELTGGTEADASDPLG